MVNELYRALAEDIEQLIRLHDRELDGETLAALQLTDFPYGLALLPEGKEWPAACTKMAAARAAGEALDELAADYAAIYLNNSLGASPYESVWLDDDHLACQRPMFELREIYAAAGFRVADWRRRYDDHLVLQLQYLSHLLRNSSIGPEKVALFVDEHVGYWLPDFARRVVQSCDTSFYAALAELTHLWLRGFRHLISEINDLPLPDRQAIGERIQRKREVDRADVAPIRFMPGGRGPSW